MADDLKQYLLEWHDPMTHIAKGLSQSGLEYMQAFINGDIPNTPIAVTMGFEGGGKVEYGRVVFKGTPTERVLNPSGMVHGGFAATLLDSAMGCAVHTTLDQGVGYSTMQLNIHYTRAMTPNEEVTCEGVVVHRGKRSATAEGKITNTDGKVVAHGTTVCMIFPLTK